VKPAWLHRTAIAVALAFLAGAAGPPVAAQQPGSILDPGAAHLRRELRSLENRGPSLGRDLDLSRARRDLLRQGQGGYFTPEQALIGRELERQRREGRRSVPHGPKGPTVPFEEELPRSYGEDLGLPSSVGRGLSTAGRLVDRAEAALRDGRPGQARSDLSTARTFLPTGSSGADAQEFARLKARIDGLETRLAAGGD
jgi:hypothetical protein